MRKAELDMGNIAESDGETTGSSRGGAHLLVAREPNSLSPT